MPSKIELTVTNIDKNGNIIKDLSKLVVPDTLQIELLNRINNRKLSEARGN